MATDVAVRVDIRSRDYPGPTGRLFTDLSFRMAEGEVLALIGASGVGKSALLRMIAGIDTSFDGTIRVFGRPADAAPPPGFVFQDPRLLPWLDAVENIRAVSPRTSVAEARALLADMGLSGHETALPGALSGGMQRRVALARALAVGPRLLLLDEPFVSIDRALVRELQSVVSRLIAERRPTMILVSHEPEDAARLADRVLHLAGRPARITHDLALPRPRDSRGAPDVQWLLTQLDKASRAR